jgi:hypothetical protein
LEFGVLLVFTLWKKQFSDEEDKAFAKLNSVCYRLIESKRYPVSIRILDYSLRLKGSKIPDATKKMMFVNLASAHKHVGDHQKCEETLNEVDWSGSSKNYKLCVAALRGELDEMCRLMEVVKSTGSITKQGFQEWPVFDFVRETEAFATKFFDLYKEQLVSKDPTSAIELPENPGQDLQNPDHNTIH